jgi:hypothetical protein
MPHERCFLTVLPFEFTLTPSPIAKSASAANPQLPNLINCHLA